MKKSFLIIQLLFIISIGWSQSASQKGLTAVFPADGPAPLSASGFSFSQDYTPSGSSWAVTWGENRVFEALFKYENPTNPNENYELRLGKGGQIYSFITSTGEAIPPQFREDPKEAPWIDEVWQLVAVDKSQNNAKTDAHYFIHQAGVYIRDPVNLSVPFYSPQVAEYFNEMNQEYTTVNWGQHAHIGDNLIQKFKSSILYYTKIKNLGRGMIQVDYLIYNFGDDYINHINMPWGGVRHSTFGNFFISNSANNYRHQTGEFATTSFETAATNGWVGFSSNSSGTAPSMGLLSDNSTGLLRVGDASNIPERDYTAYSNIRTNIDLSFGKQLHIRNYFVLAGTMDAVKNKIANSLTDKSNDSLKTNYNFDNQAKTEVDSIHYFFNEKGTSITAIETTSKNGLRLRLQPYANSYPVFIITRNTGIVRVTSDLYTFSELPYDGTTSDVKLLGFRDAPTTVKVEFDTIYSGDSYTFYDGVSLTNITSNKNYVSQNGLTVDGQDRFIQTKLIVLEKTTGLQNISENNLVDPALLSGTEVYNTLGQLVLNFHAGMGGDNISKLDAGKYVIVLYLVDGSQKIDTFIQE